MANEIVDQAPTAPVDKAVLNLPHDDFSPLDIVSVLLRQRRIVLWVIIVASGISLLVALRRPTRFTSTASFFSPASVSSVSSAFALAQQFGLSLGNSAGERAPEFYADLVTSIEILRQTITEHYPLRSSEERIDLVEYYEVVEEGDEGAEVGIMRAMKRLRNDLSVRISRETGVVSLSVTTSDPVLSKEIAEQIFKLVNNFDLTTRQSQAGAERHFVGERLAQVESELRGAEDRLKDFLVENRVFSNSPQLQFEHDRLQRDVALRHQLVSSIAQAHESARIDEVRNTPVITLIQPPRVPALRDPKRRIFILALGVMLGAMLAVLAAFVRNYMQEARARKSPDFEEVSSLWNEVAKDFRRLPRGLFTRSME